MCFSIKIARSFGKIFFYYHKDIIIISFELYKFSVYYNFKTQEILIQIMIAKIIFFVRESHQKNIFRVFFHQIIDYYPVKNGTVCSKGIRFFFIIRYHFQTSLVLKNQIYGVLVILLYINFLDTFLHDFPTFKISPSE